MKSKMKSKWVFISEIREQRAKNTPAGYLGTRDQFLKTSGCITYWRRRAGSIESLQPTRNFSPPHNSSSHEHFGQLHNYTFQAKTILSSRSCCPMFHFCKIVVALVAIYYLLQPSSSQPVENSARSCQMLFVSIERLLLVGRRQK